MTFDPIYITFSPKIMYIVIEYTALSVLLMSPHKLMQPHEIPRCSWRGQMVPLQLSFRFLLISPQDWFVISLSISNVMWAMHATRQLMLFSSLIPIHHVSTGWPIEREWPADSHQWRISPGTIQSRCHGDTEALNVLRRQFPGHYPACRAPSTQTGRRGRSLNAVSFNCWPLKTIQVSLPVTIDIEFLRHGS